MIFLSIYFIKLSLEVYFYFVIFFSLPTTLSGDLIKVGIPFDHIAFQIGETAQVS